MHMLVHATHAHSIAYNMQAVCLPGHVHVHTFVCVSTRARAVCGVCTHVCVSYTLCALRYCKVAMWYIFEIHFCSRFLSWIIIIIEIIIIIIIISYENKPGSNVMSFTESFILILWWWTCGFVIKTGLFRSVQSVCSEVHDILLCVTLILVLSMKWMLVLRLTDVSNSVSIILSNLSRH